MFWYAVFGELCWASKEKKIQRTRRLNRQWEEISLRAVRRQLQASLETDVERRRRSRLIFMYYIIYVLVEIKIGTFLKTFSEETRTRSSHRLKLLEAHC